MLAKLNFQQPLLSHMIFQKLYADVLFKKHYNYLIINVEKSHAA